MGRKKAKKTSPFEQYINDIVAVLFFALGIILAIAVFFKAAGTLGEYLENGLKFAFGSGRYIFPFVLMLLSIGIAKNNRIKTSAPTITGLLLAFVSSISIISISSPSVDFFNQNILINYGGYTGSAIAFVLTKIMGETASYILLFALIVIGVLLSTDKTLSEYGKFISRLFDWLKEQVLHQSETTKEKNKTKKVEVSHHRDHSAETQIMSPDKILEDNAKISEEDQMEISPTKLSKADFAMPPLSLLNESDPSKESSNNDVSARIQALEKTMKNFDVNASVIKATQGPAVTLYEIQLGSGVKVNKISNLEQDIALALATPDIRIIAPIPGKSAVGIEVPNSKRELVTLGDILKYKNKSGKGILSVGLGKDISGEPIFADIAAMPHILIAGATGSGKSVAINSLIISILMNASPTDVRLILIDPKLVELSVYNGIPHLLTPVVSYPKKAAIALNWAVNEMETRYQRLFEAGAKNITGYNQWLSKANPEVEPMPYLLIVIDELADLMMASASDVESSICRIAQKARAVGIHLIVATQRPSVDVITGLIKANITTRIAFAVSTQADSRVIIDAVGAEKLIGKGDMLYMSPATLRAERIQGAFVSEKEVEGISKFIKQQGEPKYDPEILEEQKSLFENGGASDSLWKDAGDIVMAGGQASVSMLQRRLGVGYTRAGRLMDILESKGIVGGYEGSKPRSVLISMETWEDMRKESENDY